jgi:hypothetical protein
VVIWPSRHSPRPEAIELKEEVETHDSQRACDVLEAILILNKLSTRGSPGAAMYVWTCQGDGSMMHTTSEVAVAVIDTAATGAVLLTAWDEFRKVCARLRRLRACLIAVAHVGEHVR